TTVPRRLAIVSMKSRSTKEMTAGSASGRAGPTISARTAAIICARSDTKPFHDPSLNSLHTLVVAKHADWPGRTCHCGIEEVAMKFLRPHRNIGQDDRAIVQALKCVNRRVPGSVSSQIHWREVVPCGLKSVRSAGSWLAEGKYRNLTVTITARAQVLQAACEEPILLRFGVVRQECQILHTPYPAHV